MSAYNLAMNHVGSIHNNQAPALVKNVSCVGPSRRFRQLCALSALAFLVTSAAFGQQTKAADRPANQVSNPAPNPQGPSNPNPSSTVQASLTQGGLSEGQDGFFFLDLRDLNYYSEDLNRFSSRVSNDLEIVSKVNAVLAKRNIKLVFVLVPMIERVYESKLPNGFKLPKMIKDFYGKTIKTLQSQSVMAPNLNTPFLNSSKRADLNQPMYMRQDNHWSSVGAVEGARVTAETMQKYLAPILTDLPEARSSLEWGEQAEFNGNYYKLLTEAQQQRVARERMRTVKFSQLSSSNDLLGESTPAIHVLGTSFTENRSFGFSDGLGYYLSKPTLNVAQSGKGPWTPVFDYLGSNEFQQTPPKILVWEFPESFLVREMKPIHQSGDWGRNEFVIQSAANIGADCSNTGIGPATTTQNINGQGFEVRDQSASSSSTTTSSAVRYNFSKTLRIDQYVSFVASSASSNSLYLETVSGKPNRYYAKLDRYGVAQRVNIPLWTVADGQTQSFNIKTAAGSDLKLDDLKLCTMPKDLLQLMPSVADLNLSSDLRRLR